MKIRIRVILVIVLTNFMIILLSILAGTGYVRENIEKYIEADMMVVADIADRFISSELDLLKYEAGMIANSLAPAPPADWGVILAGQTRQYPKFTGMTVMGKNAVIAAAAGKMPAPPSVLGNEHIQKAFSGQKAFTSTVPADNTVAFYLAVHIAGAADHILILTLDGMYFSNLASEYHVWETGHIFIDDREGYVIANIRPEWVHDRQNFILRAQNDPQYENLAAVIKKLTAGERGIDYYSMDGISRICAYRPISASEEGWRLGIVAPLSESPVRNVDKGLFLVAVVSFLLNIVAAVIASDFIKKPFEAMAALQETAEADSKAKSSFLAHMSHEIRTPLNAVIGLSELTLGEKNLSRESKVNLEKIYGAGATILSIVNDILDISKIESGKFELNAVRYDTPSLINDTVTLNIVRIGEKDITFNVYVDENLPGTLYGDDLRVKQIFNNLLSNAFKYTHAGTVSWRISFERDGDDIWLTSSIKDTGIGISPENMQKLFLDYHQVDTRTNRQVEGTGLGLAISKRLVEMMGGTITVESEYGKGATFYVRLRQTLVSGTPIGKALAENLMALRYTLSRRDSNTKLARINLSYAHILVVDDIETNLDVVKGIMKPYGMKIDCAFSGQQAIDMIRAENPLYSAIFMDHMMPGMDGIEATRIIREEIGTDYARNIPIIALTANAIVGNEEMFLYHGFQSFISKPIDTVKLDSLLRQWVRDKNLEKQLWDTDKDACWPDSATAGAKIKIPLPDVISINGIDAHRALERFGGDNTVFIDVLRSYAANTPPLLNSLRKYFAAGNLEDYAIVAHGIKGSSYGIAADKIGDAAEALETTAKTGNFAAVKTTHKAFEDIINTLLQDIQQALAAIDAATNKPSSSEPDPALLEQLREACAAFDMDTVDRVMENLESLRYERGGKLVAWLRDEVNNMAFEKISDGKWPYE